MTCNIIIRSLALSAALGLSTSVMADDLTPPPWRFNPGTTVQHWDFSAGPGGGAPDAGPFLNPYGTPMLSPGTSTWMPFFSGRPAVWDISAGGLNFDVPNTGVQTHMKELWLQVTYLSAAPGGPGYSVAGPFGPFSFVSSSITTLPGGWIHELTKWTTPICPPFERVAIVPGATGAAMFIDQVVIDTQCIPIPSPASASLLSLAGLCAFRRRRTPAA